MVGNYEAAAIHRSKPAVRRLPRVCDDTLYQKVVTSKKLSGDRYGFERLYAINVFFWYFDKYFPGRGAGTTASCEATLCRPKGDGGVTRFSVSISIDEGTTIEQIEQFCARAFSSLECVADPDLNEE